MHSKVLLMSRFSQETFQMKDLIIRQLKQNVDWVRTPQQALHALMDSRIYGAVVINTDIFTKRKIEMVNQLRAIGCQAPVIYVADLIHMDARTPIPESKRTIVVEKPVTSEDLQGIIERAQKASSFHTRYNKRFVTFEKSKIEVFRNGKKFDGLIRNLSLGGAFIETNQSFIPGETLKVHIQLNEIGSSHEMSGRVVWNKIRGMNGIGIKFVRAGEVYSETLKQLQ